VNDQSQRDQALDISDSYIVQAPAGSGKTELLTQRYLKLLSISEEPENILAMTFTNKAADELKYRVIRSLESQNICPKDFARKTHLGACKSSIETFKAKRLGYISNPSRIKNWNY
jgi:ATP-dependent exoDNAse (exonuclease V) beta subunit